MRSVQNKQHPGSRADRIRAQVRAIPEGFVQTYGDIDAEAPRLVGRILATHHPTGEPSSREDIPWHRVVRFDGRPPLGTSQLALLRTDGVPITGDRVDLKRARLARTHMVSAPADTPIMTKASNPDAVEDLLGKRALISGGTRGTGAAIVARLKAAGAHVTASGRHAPEHLDADAFIAANIATSEGTSHVIEQITRNGGVDIIVHVAGGGPAPSGGFAMLTDELGARRWNSTCWVRYGSTAGWCPP